MTWWQMLLVAAFCLSVAWMLFCLGMVLWCLWKMRE